MSQTVSYGIYRFFTKAQLDAERTRYIAQVQTANTQVTGASVNGQSFQLNVNGREMTLEEWADALAGAYNDLGVYTYGTPTANRVAARF